MPMYDCTVLTFADGTTHQVATFGFDHEAPTDPHLTFTFSPGRDGLAALRDEKAREELAADVARAVWEYVRSRGGLVDPEDVDLEVSDGLKALTPQAAEAASDLVFGSTHWGDIVLDRHVAEAWAETARLLGSGLAWAELCYRLPGETRPAIEEVLQDWFSEEYEDCDELPPDAVEAWSDAISDEGGVWPWLALDEYQADLGRLPESLQELIDDSMEYEETGDGEYVYWEEADDLIAALNEAGVRAVRDDELVDRAMGPFGSSFGEAGDEAVRLGHTKAHPLPTVAGEVCPCCDASQLVPIEYGYMEYHSRLPRDWIAGGCMVTPGQPTQACRACGLHLGPEGEWLRRTHMDEPTEVTRRRLPPLEVGLADLFERATATWGAPLGLTSDLINLIPSGYTAGDWLLGVLAPAGGDAGAETPPLSHYMRSDTGDWHREGGEWDGGPGLLHVRSLEEPIGSILIRHPDGTVETVYGVDAFGLADDARDHFDM